MKKPLILGLLCLAAVSGFAQQPEDQDETRVKVGQQVPPFTVNMYGGGSTDIADLKGKVVLVNFWATWCPPCRAEMKRVPEEVVKKFAGQDFVLLAISRGDTEDKIAKLRADNGYTFPMAMDPDESVFGLFAARGIPRNFIVDRAGKIAHVGLGYEPAEFDELVKKIENTLKQR